MGKMHRIDAAERQLAPHMATSQSTMDFLLDILSDSKQVSARKMFGEYCLYYAGRPVGLVCDEQLYLKRTDVGKGLMKFPDEGAPFPGARPHLRIGPDDWDDRSWLNALVRATFDSLPPPKLPQLATPPKPRKSKPKNA
jgi:DNA transformation protein